MMKALVLGVLCSLALVGCSSYASVAISGDGTKALVAKNGLFGKSVFVCAVSPAGLTSCAAQESP
jgi:hypothetical protein